MPLILPPSLPAVATLRDEEYILTGGSAPQAPLRIGIVNLMPLKQMTECDLLRHLSATPLPVEIDLIDMASHRSLNTPPEHIEAFYTHFNPDRHYDGLIITGAPVEKIAFEDVDYWPELCAIMDEAKARVRSTLYICWGAFAGLYRHHGIGKQILTSKISGVFPHTAHQPLNPMLRGFDDIFYVPHSRYTALDPAEVAADPALTVLTTSPQAGIHMVMSRQGREFFITGHSEYAPGTLDFEYRRDLAKGINPSVPANYYRDDDPERGIIVRWRSTASLLFANWLHYFVNPGSPYAPRV